MNDTLKNLTLILIFSIFSTTLSAQIIRMETVFGNIDIEMHPDAAPDTVANFLTYMNDGDYNNSFIHRNGVSEGVVFVVQGGGFKFTAGQPFAIEPNPAVNNEFQLSNIRGTIAMAKLANLPDSATSQWFFNTVDNSQLLDTQNGGFTVFGTVIDGMDVVDAIAALESGDFPLVIGGSLLSFDDFPFRNEQPVNLTEDDVALIRNVFVIDGPLAINAGLNGAWFNIDTPGQGILIEILPTLEMGFMGWFTHDTDFPADGVVANIGDAGNRWISGLGPIDADNNSITLDLVSTSGGLFDSSQQTMNTEANTYGTMTITFENCSTATVTYNLIAQELTNTFNISRISGDNVALCQRLSSESN